MVIFTLMASVISSACYCASTACCVVVTASSLCQHSLGMRDDAPSLPLIKISNALFFQGSIFWLLLANENILLF